MQKVINNIVLLLLTIILLCINNLYAQNNTTDSLKQVWLNEKITNSVRIEALHKFINNIYSYSNFDSVFYYTQLEYDFAKKTESKKYMALALNRQGIIFRKWGNYTKAIEYSLKALEIAEKIGDNKEISKTLNTIGNIYAAINEYDKALEYLLRSLKLVKHHKFSQNAVVLLTYL